MIICQNTSPSQATTRQSYGRRNTSRSLEQQVLFSVKRFSSELGYWSSARRLSFFIVIARFSGILERTTNGECAREEENEGRRIIFVIPLAWWSKGYYNKKTYQLRLKKKNCFPRRMASSIPFPKSSLVIEDSIYLWYPAVLFHDRRNTIT